MLARSSQVSVAKILIQQARQSMAEEKALGIEKTKFRISGKVIVVMDLHYHVA